jgi:hypothetical protein
VTEASISLLARNSSAFFSLQVCVLDRLEPLHQRIFFTLALPVGDFRPTVTSGLPTTHSERGRSSLRFRGTARKWRRRHFSLESGVPRL